MKPIISIVIPVYNAELYLEVCLTSIKKQTYSDFQVLLVDDGSTDSSCVICQNFEKNDSRFVYLYQNNSGPSAARNYGIRESKGEYIWFVDADDWIEENALQDLVNYLKQLENRVDIFSFSFVKEYSSNQKIITHHIKGLLDKDTFQVELLSQNNHFGLVWSSIFLAETIKKNSIYFNENLNQSEDTEFVVRLCAYANNIYVSEKVLYHYRVIQNSLSRGFREGIAENYISAINIIRNSVEKTGNIQFYLVFLDYVKSMVIFAVLNDYFHPQNNKSYRERKKRFLNMFDNTIIDEALKIKNVSSLGMYKSIVIFLIKHKLSVFLMLIGLIKHSIR